MRTKPESKNPGWGFYGTMGELAEAGWVIAIDRISDRTGEDFDAVGSFLDSKSGRHFADEVRGRVSRGVGLALAIEQIADRWMAFPMSRATRVREGFPAGVPYLTCFVVQAAMDAEDCS